MGGNYKKWLNRINTKLDKGGYIGNAQDLKDEIDEKMDIPTITNNYYGLWNDTNKEFINGTLREEDSYLQSTIPVKIDGTPIVPKESSESLFVGTYPQNITGGQNTIFGYKNGRDLTTGYANLLIGLNASPTMTSGIGNITITGWGAGGYNPVTGNQELPITGKHNIAIGTSANHNITSGSRNIAVGNGTLTRITTGSNNIGIGYSAAIGLTTGKNNIVIGNYAGGTSATQATNQTMTNKLVIHNIVNSTTGDGLVDRANSFWESVPSPNGTNTWDTSLITGDFYERWVKFQGKFIIGSSYMPVADTTYTKNIVAKPDGTFGWTDGLVSDKVRFNLSASITPTPNTLVPKTDGSGLLWYDNNSAANELFYIPQNWVLGRTPNNSYNYNTRIGVETMLNISYGENNVGIGRRALEKLTTGSYNTAIGNYAGNFITISDDNVFLGAFAGHFNTASNNLTNISKSVYIGNTTSGTENAINETVIGYCARGNGSNTVTLGHTTIVNTYLRGKVNLNDRLKLASYTKTQRDALTNNEVGDMIWQKDAGNSGIRVFNGTNWLALQTTID